MADAYRGRFAPSPTGPLHFGSLLSAVASYLDARQQHGTWLIRIEDVDGTRCSPRFQTSILDTLTSYGLISDEPVLVQSERHELYQAYLQQLIEQDLAYPCNCTRAALACYQGLHPHRCDSHTDQPHSWRAHCDQGQFEFFDPIQQQQRFDLAEQPNHPVLKRKDGYFSYQLAVVVDDHLQAISDIVRGADLLDTTGQQLWLYQQFDWQAPKLCHLPLIVNERGDKISKQNHAKAIENGCCRTLKSVLHYLGLRDIPHDYSLSQLLDWASTHWQRQHLTQQNLSLAEKDLDLIG
ncbi:tRNA glutamyl-Q(34) synthetase GluQRS [Marinomonas ostreistagni]|uniref:tRNA glutamyl-Q(34) synthetase GluQRS n=1 Tax=Marinomonas ostreistagni TaxID=359209 RepID=UPI00194F480F|nr:tRNA glutamyl-Q(34) synthetase GluQRS [Marinomonas ostreistagni]MBM6552225.1 tRNA glutamyl-Q(34) synthetase GluQRS [Marinomonas ostreistagni]